MSTDPLKAAQEAVELRKKATDAEWSDCALPDCNALTGIHNGSQVVCECWTEYQALKGMNHLEARENLKFIIHAGNHYAAVSQALIDAQAKLDAIGSPEWRAMAEAAIAVATEYAYGEMPDDGLLEIDFMEKRAAYLAAKGESNG